jgi:hypothetical protein
MEKVFLYICCQKTKANPVMLSTGISTATLLMLTNSMMLMHDIWHMGWGNITEELMCGRVAS